MMDPIWPQQPTRLTRRRLLASTLAAAIGWTLFPPRVDVAWAQGAPTRVLANGLRVIVEPRPSADTIAIVLGSRVGSREDGDHPGINGFTGQTMFQGAGQWPSATALQRAAALAGGTLDLSAGTEISAISSLMPSRRADLGFQLVSSVCSEPLFDPAAVQRQKLLSAQQLAQRATSVAAVLSDLFLASMFEGHPVARSGAGTAEAIASLDRRDLIDHYQRYWVGANVTLAVAGRIGPDDAMELAQRYFGELPAGSANDRPAQSTSGPQSPTLIQHALDVGQVAFRLGFAAPSRRDPDAYSLMVLSAMMNGFSGRLLPALRSERGLVYDAGAAYQAFTDTGSWFVAGSVDPSNLEEALTVTQNEIDRVRQAEASGEEVAGKVTQMAGGQILAEETNMAHAGRSIRRAILGIEATEELLRRLRAVTPADVRRVADTYLDPAKSLLVLVGPPPVAR